jgi:hypothetical protein
MKKIGLFAAGGAALTAIAVVYMPVAPADPHGSCSASSNLCSAPGFTGPSSQYPPIPPGALPPGLTRPSSQYPPITPGAVPPGLTGQNLYPPITPGVLPPGLAKRGNQSPSDPPAGGATSDASQGAAGAAAG